MRGGRTGEWSEAERRAWFFVQADLARHDPDTVATVVELYRELTGKVLMIRGDASDSGPLALVRHELERRLQAGQLRFEQVPPVVTRVRERIEPVVLGPPPPSPAEPPPESEPSVVDFIEIGLRDRDGKPVPGVRYTVKLPDGSERSGRLDRNGFARISGIDPGTCEVSFPDLHGPEWIAA